MNYGEIVSQVASIVEDTSQAADTDIRNMINNIYQDIAAHAFWPELEKSWNTSSVANQQTYNLTDIGTDIAKIKSVLYLPQNISSDFLTVKPERDIAKIMREDSTVYGDPLRWCEWEAKLYFWPVPDYAGTNNIRILGKKTISDLADDADEPFFPSRFHKMLIYGGAWNYFDKDDDVRAQIYERYYFRDLQKMEFERVARRDEDDDLVVQFGD